MRTLLFVSVALLFALGLMMVFDTSSAEVLDRALDRHTHYALFRQLFYALVGGVVGLGVFLVGYHCWVEKAVGIYLTLVCALVLVFLFPGVNGAHRWLRFGGVSLQPSEFAKLFVPLMFVRLLGNRPGEELSFWEFVKIPLILLIPMALILIEPDNGTAAVMGVSLLPLLFLAKIPYRFYLLPMLLCLVVGGFVAYQLPYVRGRLEVYLHPERDLTGRGHQPHQAKIAAGSGGLFGKGPGASLQKMTYLPEAQNDYIAAIYAEEFGFVGMLALILLYMLIAYAGYAIAFRASDQAGFLLAAGLTFLITFQAFLNLGVVSGLLPSKGVNLPFFSQGGSSLIANNLAIGLLLSIAKRSESWVKSAS